MGRNTYGGNAAVGRRMTSDTEINKASPKRLLRAAVQGQDYNTVVRNMERAAPISRGEKLAHAYGRHSGAIQGTALTFGGAGAVGHQVRERRKRQPDALNKAFGDKMIRPLADKWVDARRVKGKDAPLNFVHRDWRKLQRARRTNGGQTPPGYWDGNVGKRERVYDAHDAQQRRLGAMAGATGIVGGGLTAYGTHGAVRRSRDVRAVAEEMALMPGFQQKGGAGGGSKTLPDPKTRIKAQKLVSGSTVHLSPKHLGALGGGALLLGTAGELARRGRSDSNRRWH